MGQDESKSESSTMYLLNLKGGKDKRREERKNLSGSGKIDVVLQTRPSPRKKPPFEIHARVLSNAEFPCTLEDVSLSGLKIKGKAILEVGKEIGIYFLVPVKRGEGQEQAVISPTCKVVWQEEGMPPRLCGLQIVSISAQQKSHYDSFVNSLPEPL